MRTSLLAICSLVAAVPNAFAQGVVAPNAQSFLEPTATTEINPFEKPNREYNGLKAGNWMLYPSLFVGASFDSNVKQSNAGGASDVGLRLTPTLVAARNTGVHNTLFYALADVNLYRQNSQSDIVNARLGFQHIWEASRDLAFKLNAEASRLEDASTNGQTYNDVALRPTFYEVYTTGLSARKSFGKVFVASGVAFANTTYEDTPTSSGFSISQKLRDFNALVASNRFGYQVTPLFYAFGEVDGVWRDYYNNNPLNSNGYRVVGGLGTDRVGLVRGEVFGGYQAQFYQSARIGSVGGGVLGGKLSWYPTSYATISATVDQTIGESAVPTTSNPNGLATYATTPQLSVDYALSQSWTAQLRAGLVHTSYFRSSRIDNSWTLGGTLSFKILKNLALTLDESFTKLASNQPENDYVRSITSMGLTYKY
jgi:hypothetical protein